MYAICQKKNIKKQEVQYWSVKRNKPKVLIVVRLIQLGI